MTVSKPPIARRISDSAPVATRLPTVTLLCALFLLFGHPTGRLAAQEGARYVRLHLRDKGTPERTLSPGDPLYSAASAHLTPRALARRAKVLPADALVSTDDLPPHAPYLSAIAANGATIVQSSRWLNTVMVRADSMTIERLRGLPFLERIDVVRANAGGDGMGLGKRLDLASPVLPVCGPSGLPPYRECFVDRYGLADFQNRFMGIDEAHRMGFAGEGVLVGVLDAGFDWRNHRAFWNSSIVAERDFIYGDDNTADEAADSLVTGGIQEEHGTMVLSLMAASLEEPYETTTSPGLVGGAPRAMYMLAKTEDLRHERHVEEDTFVAGLEWLESQGVDVTNTSLGYTTFDPPERPHTHDELDGHTAHASRAVNHAVALGVVCIVAAGNEGRPGSFVYVSVPGEADSAIAAAAVDSTGSVASFSSRGFPSRFPFKPDVAALGVGNRAAHPSSPSAFVSRQGTSFAAPMTAAVAAILLSAAPELRPWEVRELLQRSGTRADDPDTAVGHGLINAGRVLRELARRRTVVGTPAFDFDLDFIALAAYTLAPSDAGRGELLDSHLIARVRLAGYPFMAPIEARGLQPRDGLARWTFPIDDGMYESLAGHGRPIVDIVDARTGALLRRDTLESVHSSSSSTMCARPILHVFDAEYDRGNSLDPTLLSTGGVEIYPNPASSLVRFSFLLAEPAAVTLDVYDSRGERVATVLDGAELPAGSHTPILDARGLSSGAYYVRLRVGDEVRSGEMIFIPE